jgi:hypothetical protein
MKKDPVLGGKPAALNMQTGLLYLEMISRSEHQGTSTSSNDRYMRASGESIAQIATTEMRDSALNVSRPPPPSICSDALDHTRSREHLRREHVNTSTCRARAPALGKRCTWQSTSAHRTLVVSTLELERGD